MVAATSATSTHSTLPNLLLFAGTATAYTLFCRRNRKTIVKTPNKSTTPNPDDYKGIEKRACPNCSWKRALEDTEKSIFVDTRTPKEFALEHAWNAINVPLLDNEQRHVVGSTYHQQSKQAAIDKGWELFGPIVREFVERFKKYEHLKIYIYCWRGGMRSRIVTNLLNLHGFRAVQVQGGFKRYMNEVVWKGLEEFGKSYAPTFVVLFGHTGCRKTELLHALRDKAPVLDLEGLADHKGSIYGSVNCRQRTQKMFSIGLYHALDELKEEPLVFCEGEAQKVGNVHLPEFVFSKILNDKAKVLVRAELDTRIQVIRKEYFCSPDCVKQMHEITSGSTTLERTVGKKMIQKLHEMLDDEARHDEFIEYLLVNYYDERYRFDKFGHEYQIEVHSDDLGECCRQLMEFYQQLSTQQAKE